MEDAHLNRRCGYSPFLTPLPLSAPMDRPEEQMTKQQGSFFGRWQHFSYMYKMKAVLPGGFFTLKKKKRVPASYVAKVV